MFKNHTRRKGGGVSRSTYTPDRFSAGNKNFFTPLNRISQSVTQYTNTIETISPIYIEVPQSNPPDCTEIVNEYNLIKSELIALRTLFSNPSTEIDTVLENLQ